MNPQRGLMLVIDSAMSPQRGISRNRLTVLRYEPAERDDGAVWCVGQLVVRRGAAGCGIALSVSGIADVTPTVGLVRHDHYVWGHVHPLEIYGGSRHRPRVGLSGNRHYQ
jgi:hypothetical protein